MRIEIAEIDPVFRPAPCEVLKTFWLLLLLHFYFYSWPIGWAVGVGGGAQGQRNWEPGIILPGGNGRGERVQGTAAREGVSAHPPGGKPGPDVQSPPW